MLAPPCLLWIWAAVLLLSAEAAAGQGSDSRDPVDGPLLELMEDEAFILPLLNGPVRHRTVDSIRVVKGAERIRLAIHGYGFVRIVPAADSSGAFVLRLFSSDGGMVTIEDMRGDILPRTDLRAGRLQSNETHQGAPGIIRVYTEDRELLAEIEADESGRFPTTQLPQDRKGYLIQAAISRRGERAGYVRTIRMNVPQLGSDLHVPVIRAVPFDGLPAHGLDSLEFRRHVQLVTRGTLGRWDLDDVGGVHLQLRTSQGGFSADEVDRMQRLFEHEDGVPALIGGRSVPVDPVVDHMEGSFASGWANHPQRGKITIVPDSTADVSSFSEVRDTNGDGLYDAGLIAINPARTRRLGSLERQIVYEGGRVLGMVGSSDPLFFAHTVMVSGSGPQVPDLPTAIDRKTAAILYEETFPVGLDLDYVLGLQFEMPQNRPQAIGSPGGR